MLNESGSEDLRFSTYHLYPRAENLLEKAGWEDGDSVPPESFYALIVEGDVYNEARPNGIGIKRVPLRIRQMAKEVFVREAMDVASDQLGLESCRWTIDIFDEIYSVHLTDGSPGGALRSALSWASWFALHRHALRARIF